MPSSSSSSSSPYVVDTVSDIHCRVCGRKYDGSQHFGIDICRACAAFFRRSVTVKKTFVCRRGTDNCALNTISRKTTCQKCRWMRCLDVGLQADLVVQRKSPDFVKANASRPHKHDDEESDSGSEGKYGEEMDESLPPVQFSVLRPIPTIANPNLDTTKATLINRVLINYNEFTRQRLEVELSLPHTQDDSKFFGSTGIPLFKATRDTVSLIYQKQVDLLHVFLSNTFNEYAVCGAEEQKRICAIFSPVLWEIESCYWTYRNMPVKAEYDSLLMCTQTTYIDAKDVRPWLGNTSGQDEETVQKIELRLENLLKTARSMVLEPMHKLIIKEFEFIMILALNIWAARNHRGNLESEARADAVRLALFNDIHILYHDGLKIDNYACRIGEIMGLLTDVQNADISSNVQNLLFADLTANIYSL
uniref:Nuclear receptor domain-containing protein n=1 Tax=Caenorhabditis japonica TaxID=281687 RepID=A0A8R1DZE0_CAEJA